MLEISNFESIKITDKPVSSLKNHNIFINRRRDRMKMLVWESGGYMLYYKRLEQGQFELPQHDKALQFSLTWETLVLMLTGISIFIYYYHAQKFCPINRA